MSVDIIKNSANIKITKITIDSDDRTSGTNTNFTYDLGVTIENIKMINIRSVELENLIYNINDYQNSFIYTSPLGVTTNISLENSIYPVTRLATTLEDTLNEIDDSNVLFKVRFDGYEKMSISTIKGITTFGIDFTEESSIGDILGFGSTNFSGVTHIVGSTPINLTYSKNLFLGSTILGENKFDQYILSNGASNVLKHIDIPNNFGDLIHDDESLNVNLRTEIPSLTSIDFRLVDDRNREPPLSNAKVVISLDIYSRLYNDSFNI